MSRTTILFVLRSSAGDPARRQEFIGLLTNAVPLPENSVGLALLVQECLVGLYSRLIFPWLCDMTLGKPFLAKHRQDLLSAADGDILEIGFGTGLNLSNYPSQVRKIIAGTEREKGAGFEHRESAATPPSYPSMRRDETVLFSVLFGRKRLS